MIRFSGFLHRDHVTEILGRILSMDRETSDTLHEDSRDLNRIVNFNAYIGCLILDAFASALFERLHGSAVVSVVMQTKGALKDAIVHDLADITPRTSTLAARYRSHPQEFYRETPINGRVYRLGDGSNRVLGASRVKRFRRLAEKASRHLIEARNHSARAETVPLDEEMDAPLDVAQDRLRAWFPEHPVGLAQLQRMALGRLGANRSPATLLVSPVNDVLGVKVLYRDSDVDHVIGALDDLDDFRIVKTETHTGTYEATHLSVRFRWPRDLVLLHPPRGRALKILHARGCTCNVAEDFHDFVTTAEDEVLVEVILCSGETLIESEIGSCMHEARILAQRAQAQLQDPLARNIEYIFDYLFRFCVSPLAVLDGMPIRLSGRYMPDYIDQLHARLLGASAETDFTEACICGGNYSSPPVAASPTAAGHQNRMHNLPHQPAGGQPPQGP